MRVELFNPFITAAGEVLATELGVQVSRGALRLHREAYISEDITVLVSLVGDVWGVAILSLSFDTAKSMVSRMLGEEIEDFSELAQSGISELGNVITGQASTKLSAAGYTTDISVPTLIVGKGSRISTFDIGRLIIPLNTELGTLTLILALRET